MLSLKKSILTVFSLTSLLTISCGLDQSSSSDTETKALVEFDEEEGYSFVHFLNVKNKSGVKGTCVYAVSGLSEEQLPKKLQKDFLRDSKWTLPKLRLAEWEVFKSNKAFYTQEAVDTDLLATRMDELQTREVKDQFLYSLGKTTTIIGSAVIIFPVMPTAVAIAGVAKAKGLSDKSIKILSRDVKAGALILGAGAAVSVMSYATAGIGTLLTLAGTERVDVMDAEQVENGLKRSRNIKIAHVNSLVKAVKKVPLATQILELQQDGEALTCPTPAQNYCSLARFYKFWKSCDPAEVE